MNKPIQMPKMNVIQGVNEDPRNENTQVPWKPDAFDPPKDNVEFGDPFNWYSTGQVILDFQMPMAYVDRLNHIYELTQKIQAGIHLPFIIDGKPTKVFKLPNISKELSGKLRQEFSIYLDNEKKTTRRDNHNFLPDDIHEWIKDRIHQYIQFTKTPYVGIRTSSAWINEYDAGEYNPLHRHTVGWRKPGVRTCWGVVGMVALKMPSHMGEEAGMSQAEAKRNGYIDFVGVSGKQFSADMLTFKYEVGQFLVFPYDILHTVYPHFNKEEVRRTMPVNIDVYLKGS